MLILRTQRPKLPSWRDQAEYERARAAQEQTLILRQALGFARCYLDPSASPVSKKEACNRVAGVSLVCSLRCCA